jgi:hypothetical protein
MADIWYGNLRNVGLDEYARLETSGIQDVYYDMYSYLHHSVRITLENQDLLDGLQRHPWLHPILSDHGFE